MTIKRILLTLACVSGFVGGMQASFGLAGFDYALLKPLISRAQAAVSAVEKSFNQSKTVCINAKACAKNLYEQQKAALKVIKLELKNKYKSSKLQGLSSWLSEKQLYKAFKKLVYKNWKKTRLFPVV